MKSVVVYVVYCTYICSVCALLYTHLIRCGLSPSCGSHQHHAVTDHHCLQQLYHLLDLRRLLLQEASNTHTVLVCRVAAAHDQ